jgi:predicted outer membrane protein
MRLVRAALLLAAGTLAGCATRQPGPTEPYPNATYPARPLPGGVSPATYVAQAASIDLFVVRSSELAQLRSVNPRLRNVANELRAGHEGLASQLSFAGRRLNLLPGATMLPQHQAMFEELAASTDFDRAYLRLQRAVHGEALGLHSNYAARGGSPTLRPVAANAAALERRHLELLRGL